MSTLTVELRAGESIHVGDATVRLEFKTGKVARLSVNAPPSMKVAMANAGGRPINNIRALADMCANPKTTPSVLGACAPTMRESPPG